MTKPVRLAIIVFLLAMIVRVGLLLLVYDNLQHGSAASYASGALALHHGMGLTVNQSEIRAISKLKSNLIGDLRDQYEGAPREALTEFLPGPAFILYGFWRLLPFYNFAPYLLFQVVLDSVLIGVFSFLLARKHFILSVLTSGIMIVNLPVIKRTLMMGYDFWPQFSVLVLFIGVMELERLRYRPWQFLLIGLLVSVPIWCREITTPLPFFVALLLLYVLRKREKFSWQSTIGRLMLFIGPVIVSILLLSLFRYETTGNFRPTRSTFWHSFMAGVGQFSNPYGLISDDKAVWEFGRKINPELNAYKLSEMYLMPDSLYERTLRDEAVNFILEHPVMFARNFVYRAVIILSPALYRDGDFIPKSATVYLNTIGFLLLPLWFLGMNYLRRHMPLVFGLTLTVYLYFTLAFGWFYVVGRVILPLLFVSAMVWISGFLVVLNWLRQIVADNKTSKLKKV